jgi:Skp family chaperone for outer membrane proteins
MQSFKQRSTLLFVGTALLLASCESRSAQCQKLGTVANQAHTNQMTVYQRSVGQLAYDRTLETEIAQVRTQAAKDINAVEVSDKKLQEIRSQLASAYRKAGEVSLQTATLIPVDGRPTDALAQQIDAMRLKAEEDIPGAIQQLNIFCVSR